MKIANKLSPATKMVLIVLYTFVLFAASIFIINLSNFETSKENKYDYKNISRDENIQIVTKLVESRTFIISSVWGLIIYTLEKSSSFFE